MKGLRKVVGSILTVCIILLLSCGDEECLDGFSGSDCETFCSADIFGTWNVTDIQPAFCTLSNYEFGSGISNTIISVSLDDGTRTLTGEGLLDSDCSSMTYTVSAGGTIVSGSITFNGSSMEDRSDLGCLISAAKQ